LWVIDAVTDRNGISGLANVGTKNGWSGGNFYVGGYIAYSGPGYGFGLGEFGQDIDLAFQMDFTIRGDRDNETPLPAALPLRRRPWRDGLARLAQEAEGGRHSAFSISIGSRRQAPKGPGSRRGNNEG
jgi:hypothetical protein